MFTGLVEFIGVVRVMQRRTGRLQLGVASAMPLADVALGDSIAVDGCCLTVVEKQGDRFLADVAEESLRRTSLGELRIGSEVHLERALLPTTRLGGHIVQGHVDVVGAVAGKRADGDAVWLTIDVPPPFTRYMVEKGGVALDGVSLTLTEVGAASCSVMLVPHTQQVTHLAKKPVGARVNIEVDVIAKYVERLLATGEGALREKLRAAGITGAP